MHSTSPRFCYCQQQSISLVEIELKRVRDLIWWCWRNQRCQQHQKKTKKYKKMLNSLTTGNRPALCALSQYSTPVVEYKTNRKVIAQQQKSDSVCAKARRNEVDIRDQSSEWRAQQTNTKAEHKCIDYWWCCWSASANYRMAIWLMNWNYNVLLWKILNQCFQGISNSFRIK